MTQQVINIGAAPDDSTGDPLRLSFDKTNENFTELYAKGATEGLWNYNKTATDITTSPVSGRFKTNSGDYRGATQIAIHAITIQGIDRSSTLRTLLAGDLIQCQDSINPNAWCRYSLSSRVDHGTWFQLNVTFQADGGVASGDNQEIIFVFTASSGGGTAAPVGAEYITSSADATLTAERVLTDTATVTWDRTTAGQIKANATGGSATPVPPQGRLTLQTATPVMTSTVTGTTTIFYTPYVGNQIVLFNGTSMVPTTFSELSVATTNTANSPAAIGIFKVNDWFIWDSGGGVLRLVHGPDWTNDTTRSAGIVRVNGIWLNSVPITNGPAIQRGTYVGTTRSNASSQFDWIYGAVTAGGAFGWFSVWNTYNRVNVASMSGDSADSWTVGTAWASNAASTRHSFVSGLAEDAFDFKYVAFFSNGVNFATAGIGFDVINAFSGTTGYVGGSIAASSTAFYSTTALGFHFGAAIEIAGGTGSVAFGDAGFPASLQSGIWFSGKM